MTSESERYVREANRKLDAEGRTDVRYTSWHGDMFYEAIYHDDHGSWRQQLAPNARFADRVMVRTMRRRGWDASWGQLAFSVPMKYYEFPNHDRHVFNAACRVTWSELS